MIPVRRALVSVSDKRGLTELAHALTRYGVEILSTGGTARALRDAGAVVIDVAEYTGFPEMLDGRVKTLHPKVHGGLLGRHTAEHRAEMERHGIGAIDLVVVNLYPFEQTVARQGVAFGEAIENIDIGGPSMIRSAAKNHERVAVITDPSDYPSVIDELDESGGALSADTRFALARKAFARTAAYDAAIANYLEALAPSPSPSHDAQPTPARFPSVLTLQWQHGRTLRYGENPHQQATFYRDPLAPARPSVAFADVLQGKELSYNNLVDLEAALEAVLEFSGAAAVIVKHTNACGVAEAADGALAYVAARACDPVSAFGGVVALNRPVDGAVAGRLAETFLECVIAPSFDAAARAVLERKQNLRLLSWAVGSHPAADHRPEYLSSLLIKSMRGGLLVQTRDDVTSLARSAEVVTRRKPTDDELRALDFAWRVAKHVKSNAIVLCRAAAHGVVTVGVGAGQMSRVDSVRLAVEKAQSPVAGCVVGSDAFFPFRDGVDAAIKAGVTAVIQPGGSVRDEEVIAACDESYVAMVFTRMRHFKH